MAENRVHRSGVSKPTPEITEKVSGQISFKKQLDLHLHTYYSDGSESPKKVLTRVKEAGLTMASIVDHNSCAHIGEEEALAKKMKLNFLPGVELSRVYKNRHIHLLGYGFDYEDSELKRMIADIQERRRQGIFGITRKLRHLGFDITDRELQMLPTEYYGLMHVAQALLRKPSEKRRIMKEVGNTDLFAIINHYFTSTSEVYVPEDYLPAVKIIKLIKRCGGITSLAHPGSHLNYKEDTLIERLAVYGLNALEVFTPKHNWDQIVHYEFLAQRLKMAVTVGSNYHESFHQYGIPIVNPIGFLKTPSVVYDSFLKYLESRTAFRHIY